MVGFLLYMSEDVSTMRIPLLVRCCCFMLRLFLLLPLPFSRTHCTVGSRPHIFQKRRGYEPKQLPQFWSGRAWNAFFEGAAKGTNRTRKNKLKIRASYSKRLVYIGQTLQRRFLSINVCKHNIAKYKRTLESFVETSFGFFWTIDRAKGAKRRRRKAKT